MRVVLILLSITMAWFGQSQTNATVKLIQKNLKTYAFGEPNPVPIIGENSKIYPYHRFEGYAHAPKDSMWRVIELDNEFITVWVLPDAGGKVWGAIEKKTGKEFIYRNEVMKFRNIAMRGPWTSGGIEFNFGIIGHHPGTATPVDFTYRQDPDGSASCWVGTMDLPSRTHWRVQVRLPKDAAYFETHATWYNPHALSQSYYNWMTAAAPTADDLVLYVPGNTYLEHPGNAHPWPIDEQGRNIARYNQNNFESSKSYHVVGEYNDFFGGYYEKSRYGFGHWSRYDEIPGQKLWLWSLARDGGIWEDLLTDTDGQYIEFQAGRLFNQFSPGGQNNPITQANFWPFTTDQWTEHWFPVLDLGGLSDVSPQAIAFVNKDGDSVEVAIQALTHVSGQVDLRQGDQLLWTEQVILKPLELIKRRVPGRSAGFVTLRSSELGLDYDENPQRLSLVRPFKTEERVSQGSNSALYFQAAEASKYREFSKAHELLNKLFTSRSGHRPGMLLQAELWLRQGLPAQALQNVLKILQEDTYDAEANFLAGSCYFQLGQDIQALEMLGWAARDPRFRSGAYTMMAQLKLRNGDYQDGIHYARQALKFDQNSPAAHRLLAIAGRLANDRSALDDGLAGLKQVDPLDVVLQLEPGWTPLSQKPLTINNEFAYQTILEAAMFYIAAGRLQEARHILTASAHPLAHLWRIYLDRDSGSLKEMIPAMSLAFVQPYRVEDLAMLDWVQQQAPHWKVDYLQAILWWGLGRITEAQDAFSRVDQATDALVYQTRAAFKEQQGQNSLTDLQKAYQLDKTNRRVAMSLTQALVQKNQAAEAKIILDQHYHDEPEQYQPGVLKVKILLALEHYAAAAQLMDALHILPFEGAYESRSLYENAHKAQAIQALKTGKKKLIQAEINALEAWPERLGVGRPYEVDESFSHFLKYKLAAVKDRAALLNKISSSTAREKNPNQPNFYLGWKADALQGLPAPGAAAEEQLKSPEAKAFWSWWKQGGQGQIDPAWPLEWRLTAELLKMI